MADFKEKSIMKRRTVFGPSAMLAVGLVSFPDSINAQQK
jgi:hypothetical protein